MYDLYVYVCIIHYKCIYALYMHMYIYYMYNVLNIHVLHV